MKGKKRGFLISAAFTGYGIIGNTVTIFGDMPREICLMLKWSAIVCLIVGIVGIFLNSVAYCKNLIQEKVAEWIQNIQQTQMNTLAPTLQPLSTEILSQNIQENILPHMEKMEESLESSLQLAKKLDQNMQKKLLPGIESIVKHIMKDTYFQERTSKVTETLKDLLRSRSGISKICIICFGRNGYDEVADFIHEEKLKIMIEVVMCNPILNQDICRKDDKKSIEEHCGRMLENGASVYLSQSPPAIRASIVYVEETPVWASVQSYQFQREEGNLRIYRPESSLIVTCSDENPKQDFDKVVRCFDREFERLINACMEPERDQDGKIRFVTRRKIYFIVLDGAADRKISSLDGKTPLEYARTPSMDRLAEKGQQSYIEILPNGLAPETDSGIMELLGYPTDEYYCGRGTLECMGLERYKKYKFFAGFRVNFASINAETKKLDRRTARDLSDEELQALTAEINKNVMLKEYPSVEFELTAFGRHRGILSFYSNEIRLNGNVSNTDPGFKKVGRFSVPVSDYSPEPFLSEPIGGSEGAKITAEIVNDFVAQSDRVLEMSEINVKRRKRGQLPANCLLLRDGGTQPEKMLCFREKYQKRLTIYGQLPSEKAIAEMIGAEFGYTETFKLQHDEEYLKELADILAKDRSDIVFCHLKGPDEPGHDGEPLKKVAAIEQIDRCFVRELSGKLTPEDIVVISCDHATPCDKKIHSDDKVPLLIYGTPFKRDETKRFQEQDADNGDCKVKKARDIMSYLMCEIEEYEKNLLKENEGEYERS